MLMDDSSKLGVFAVNKANFVIGIGKDTLPEAHPVGGMHKQNLNLPHID